MISMMDIRLKLCNQYLSLLNLFLNINMPLNQNKKTMKPCKAIFNIDIIPDITNTKVFRNIFITFGRNKL